MKQQILSVAVIILLGLDPINAAALPAAQTGSVEKQQQETLACPTSGGIDSWAARFACVHDAKIQQAPMLDKRDEPASTALPPAAVDFFHELEAFLVKFENLANETINQTPNIQAEETRLQARNVFDMIAEAYGGVVYVIAHRVLNIADALVHLEPLPQTPITPFPMFHAV